MCIIKSPLIYTSLFQVKLKRRSLKVYQDISLYAPQIIFQIKNLIVLFNVYRIFWQFIRTNEIEELNPSPNILLNQGNTSDITLPTRGVVDELPRPPVINRPPEKRQRVPSAYNRFIKDEIQRIKAGNPDITHREAFSAAAKNWAHFPHIHFGLMPDQPAKRTNRGRSHERWIFCFS